MALLTDDMDITTAFFRVIPGENGGYYPEILYKDKSGILKTVAVRVAMSGGNAPTEVKLAVANLYRALDAAGLNDHPKNKPNRWPVEL